MSNPIKDAPLLPCPFCGGEAEIIQRGNNLYSTVYECTDCGCRLSSGETFNYGARWNTRASALAPDSTANLISIIADIREKTGVGGKPMLNELADAIAAEMDRRVAGEQRRLIEQGWGPPPAPLAWDHPNNRAYEPVELRAEEIYAGFIYDGPAGTTKPKWTPYGNGTKQDEARNIAREEVAAAIRSQEAGR